MTSTNYKIILDGGNETAVAESILIKIPAVKKLIEQVKKNDKITDKTTLNMNNINNSIFSHIITLVKYQSDKSDADILEFNNTIINNMDGNTLMDFILVTNKMELFHLKNLASARFLKIINNTNIDEIRKELKIKNDFTTTENKNVNDENEWLNE
jgi:hypothetical protein